MKHFCVQGEVQALFLRHEGYLGAIGAFLKGAEEDSKSVELISHKIFLCCFFLAILELHNTGIVFFFFLKHYIHTQDKINLHKSQADACKSTVKCVLFISFTIVGRIILRHFVNVLFFFKYTHGHNCCAPLRERERETVHVYQNSDPVFLFAGLYSPTVRLCK